MRLLNRNKQTLWYANPTGSEYVTDTNGLKTGEKRITYGEPVKLKISVAAYPTANSLGSNSRAYLDTQGIETEYHYRAVTYDLNCGMQEDSIVWYGRNPTETVDEKETAVPHNCKVVRKAPSLNCVAYYLKEVDVK